MLKLDFNIHDPTIQNLTKGDLFIATITVLHNPSGKYSVYKLAFPTGQVSATFWDKGTEVPSLSRDKGTTGQAQNFTTGRDGPGF